MRKVLFSVLATLVGAFLIVALVGVLLPADHVASVQAHFDQPQAEVYAKLSDFGGWPAWSSAFDEAERVDDRDGKPAWVLRGKYGDIPNVVDSTEPPRRLHTVIPEDSDIGFHGSWTWEIESDGDRTVVTGTERGTVTSPFMRFTSKFIFGHHKSLEQTLTDLGQSFGETVALERVDDE